MIFEQPVRIAITRHIKPFLSHTFAERPRLLRRSLTKLATVRLPSTSEVTSELTLGRPVLRIGNDGHLVLVRKSERTLVTSSDKMREPLRLKTT